MTSNELNVCKLQADRLRTDRRAAANKNYMSIRVLVRTIKFAARNPDSYREHRGSTGKQRAITNCI